MHTNLLLARHFLAFLWLLTVVQFAGAAERPMPRLALPKSAFVPSDIAVIVNDLDPLSVKIANYYQEKRRIPEQNMVHVRFKPGQKGMAPEAFQTLRQQVTTKASSQIQAFVLTWTSPFRVGCMSITTAFAAGFDPAFCAKGCKLTRVSPYFNSNSRAPGTDLDWRPTMALAGDNFEQVKALIDRGVASDGTEPAGTGYLLSTSNQARNVRAAFFPAILKGLGEQVTLELIESNKLEEKNDVLFYFTGLAKVPGIDSNHFLPGAIADHLTSAGGVLSGSRQMSSLRWLEAGATGSYGTVVEPCAFPQKFPHPGIVIRRYLSGESLIEAYWKSVAMPGQGIFIGEPLANPYGGYSVSLENDTTLVIRTRTLQANKRYRLLASESSIGPYQRVEMEIGVSKGVQTIRTAGPIRKYYRLIPLEKPPTTQIPQELYLETDK